MRSPILNTLNGTKCTDLAPRTLCALAVLNDLNEHEGHTRLAYLIEYYSDSPQDGVLDPGDRKNDLHELSRWTTVIREIFDAVHTKYLIRTTARRLDPRLVALPEVLSGRKVAYALERTYHLLVYPTKLLIFDDYVSRIGFPSYFSLAYTPNVAKMCDLLCRPGLPAKIAVVRRGILSVSSSGTREEILFGEHGIPEPRDDERKFGWFLAIFEQMKKTDPTVDSWETEAALDDECGFWFRIRHREPEPKKKHRLFGKPLLSGK